MTEIDPRAARVGMTISVALPSLVYVAALSLHGYFLDSGEFISVAADLGISHPPGHPFAALVLALARMVPVGPFGARVALLCAALMAAALALHHRALLKVLASMGLVRPSVAVPLAVGATLTFGLSECAMIGATRPEVYALSTLLVVACIERAVELETVRPSSDHRALAGLALAFGLALSTHHFLAMLVMPALMPTLARVHERNPRAIGTFVLGTAAGLTAFALLPLRAMASPMLAIGDPSTPGRFAWVASAAPFHENVASMGREPLADRLADVGFVLAESLSPAGFLLALFGAFVLSRDPGARRFAVLHFLYFVTALVARAWLGFVDDNPDARAYLAPAVASGTSLAVLGAGLVIEGRLGARGRDPRLLALAAVLVAGLLGSRALATVERHALARFADTDALADGLRRDLPPNAVLLAFDPATVFLFAGGEAEEHTRPDVRVVPMAFLGYPGERDALARREPALGPTLRAHALHGMLTLPELQTLAAERPVTLEMDPSLAAPVREALAPNGLVYELLPGGTTDGDERDGRRSARLAWQRLAHLVDPVRDPQMRRQVAYLQFESAAYYAGFGDLEAARASLATARAYAPSDPVLVRASAALAAATGRIDLHAVLEPAPR